MVKKFSEKEILKHIKAAEAGKFVSTHNVVESNLAIAKLKFNEQQIKTKKKKYWIK